MNSDLVGVHMAVVESNKLDNEGRIKISLQGIAGKASAYPARIASFLAGKDRGALFLPEIDDQVLVAFVNGSPDHPVVIGCLWSSKGKPPETNGDGENDVKLIRTRSGNEIRLTDTSGEEKIEILTPANGKITIRGKQITLEGDVHVTGKLEVGNGPKTTINGNEITGS